MFENAPREMAEMVEGKYGRRAASALFHLFVSAFVCACLTAIATCLYFVNKYMVSPALAGLPSIGNYRDFLVSLGITVVLLVASGTFLFSRFKKWERVFFRAIENYVMDSDARLCEHFIH